MGQLQITQDGYIEINKKITNKLNETANNFIEIGYHLKVVRDNMLYKYDGYSNMDEYAMNKHKISGSTASRFMDINSLFSSDGNSMEIKSEYINYGYSKLQEMLTLNPDDWQLINEDTKVRQIREIKAADKEETKAGQERHEASLPIVQMAQMETDKKENTRQEKETVPATSQEDIIHELIEAYWDTREELLQKVIGGILPANILAEEVCPSGSENFRHRTSILFFYEASKGIKIRYYLGGTAHIDGYSYDEFIDMTKNIMIKVTYEPEKQEAEQEEEQPNTEYEQVQGQLKLDADTDSIIETDNIPKDKNAGSIESDCEVLSSTEIDEIQNKTWHGYTKIEIKAALSYFDMELMKIIGLGGRDTQKSTYYRIAVESMRDCHKKIAAEIDNELTLERGR